MRIIVLLGLIYLALATETITDYHYCDSSDKYHVYISNVEVNPYPIEPGVDAAFNFHINVILA
jgi:hypothetical protein